MKSQLYTVPLKPGLLKAYKAFAAEITGPKKSEYAAFLKRHGLKNCKVWHQKLEEKDYIFIYHDVEESALQGTTGLAESTHPFDRWFIQELNKYYENDFREALFLFRFENSQCC